MIRPPPRSTLFPYTTLLPICFSDDELVELILRGRPGSPMPGFARAIDSASAEDRKSTRLNSSHPSISYAVFCLKKKKQCPRERPATGLEVGVAGITVRLIG